MKKIFLCVAMIALGLCITGCGEKTPTQTFNEWRNAVVAGKLEDANKLAVSGGVVLTAMVAESIKNNAKEANNLKGTTVVGEDVKNDKAIVKVKSPDGATIDLVMEKSQGIWKISDIKIKVKEINRPQ